MGAVEKNVLESMEGKEACCRAVDYIEQIIEIIKKIRNKKLLKRVYDLAEYLYLYEDGV